MPKITTIKPIKNDSEIRQEMEDLKHDYCDDKIENAEYLKKLKALFDTSNDVITKSQIRYRIIEVEGSIRRNGDKS